MFFGTSILKHLNLKTIFEGAAEVGPPAPATETLLEVLQKNLKPTQLQTTQKTHPAQKKTYKQKNIKTPWKTYPKQNTPPHAGRPDPPLNPFSERSATSGAGLYLAKGERPEKDPRFFATLNTEPPNNNLGFSKVEKNQIVWGKVF